MLGKTTQQVAWFIMFYAHWNQASVDMIPFWLKVAEKFKDQMKFGAIEWYFRCVIVATKMKIYATDWTSLYFHHSCTSHWMGRCISL